MALRPIVKFPDPRLREIAKPVTEVTDEIRELAADMLDVMYDEPGIGLAAPQVGESISLVVVDTDWTEDGAERNPLVLVNPELHDPAGSVTWSEGCLSVPDFEAEVERAAEIRLEATDLDGNPIVIQAEGLQAVCLQHEIDHLHGTLFIDRISRLKRTRYIAKRKKQLKREEEEAL